MCLNENAKKIVEIHINAPFPRDYVTAINNVLKSFKTRHKWL
jgi:hypothetical protein